MPTPIITPKPSDAQMASARVKALKKKPIPILKKRTQDTNAALADLASWGNQGK